MEPHAPTSVTASSIYKGCEISVAFPPLPALQRKKGLSCYKTLLCFRTPAGKEN